MESATGTTFEFSEWLIDCKQDFDRMVELCEQFVQEQIVLGSQSAKFDADMLAERKDDFFKITDLCEQFLQEKLDLEQDNANLRSELNRLKALSSTRTDMQNLQIPSGYNNMGAYSSSKPYVIELPKRELEEERLDANLCGDFPSSSSNRVMVVDDILDSLVSLPSGSHEIRRTDLGAQFSIDLEPGDLIRLPLVVKGDVNGAQRPRQKRFFCEFCGRGFVRRDHKEDHERTHTGERPFTCDWCDMAFAKNSTRVRHMRCHLKLPKRVKTECYDDYDSDY